MLALWEYFWTEADWAIANATAVTLTPTSGSGTVDTVSSPFTVAANGSISAVLVVSLGATGGTGVFSQVTFSLSSGATTGTFTYTPSTLGTHILATTNNQTLTDATASYETIAAVATTPSSGGHGKKDLTYHPAPDAFWEERERHIQRHIQPLLDREKAALAPNAAEVTALASNPEQLIARQAELRIRMDARNTVLALARSAQSRRELEDYTLRVTKLSLDISQLIADYYNQIAIILLLDIF
jgi:hypothetical protein